MRNKIAVWIILGMLVSVPSFADVLTTFGTGTQSCTAPNNHIAVYEDIQILFE